MPDLKWQGLKIWLGRVLRGLVLETRESVLTGGHPRCELCKVCVESHSREVDGPFAVGTFASSKHDSPRHLFSSTVP